MSNQRYERVRFPSVHPPRNLGFLMLTYSALSQVATTDADDHVENSPASPLPHSGPHQPYPIPSSPPPSFRSRNSSPSSRRLLAEDPLVAHEDQSRTLADAFDADDSDHDDDDDVVDDRQRLMRAQTNRTEEPASPVSRPLAQRQMTQLPTFVPAAPGGRVYGGGRDAVFANMSAKPTTGEEADEKPPVSKVHRSIHNHSLPGRTIMIGAVQVLTRIPVL